MEAWWYEANEMLAAGRVADAIAITTAAAKQGSLGAQVRLARFGEDAGISRERADAMVEHAARAVTEEDITAHWNLYSASELMLGHCEPEEKYNRAQRHLEMYARASGDARAALAVARRYATGTAVMNADLNNAVDWYYCAIALGSREAEHELRTVLRDA